MLTLLVSRDTTNFIAGYIGVVTMVILIAMIRADRRSRQ